MRSTTRDRQARSRVLYGVSKAATSRSIPRWAPPRVVCIGLHRACGTEQATRRSLVAGAFSVLRLPAGLATGPHKHVHSCDRDDETHADNGCRAALTFRLDTRRTMGSCSPMRPFTRNLFQLRRMASLPPHPLVQALRTGFPSSSALRRTVPRQASVYSISVLFIAEGWMV